MHGNSVKNGPKNLCLHPKLFNTTFKPYSYLMSLSCRGPVNTSTPFFFPISILEKQLETNLLFQMSLRNGFNKLYFHHYNLDERCKSFFYLASLSRHGLVNLSTPTSGNMNLTDTITNLTVD